MLACTGGTTEPSEHALHLAALDSERLDDCAALADPDRRGECTVQVMLLINRADPEHCEDLTGVWRDECFFFAADNTDRPFSDRWALCERTGAFQQDCHVHQAETEAARLAELGRPLAEVPMNEHPRVVLGYERAWARHQESP